MAEEFATAAVRFVFVYTREAHPGELYPHLTSEAQKLQHARKMVGRDAMQRSMLVDDLQGTIHHAYGRLPNMTYVIGGGGKIVYRASWTDADNIRLVVEHLVRSREQRRQGTEHRPYYVEWEASVAAERVRFVELLLQTAGPKAVTEFIASMESTMGAGVARPLHEWWQAQR